MKPRNRTAMTPELQQRILKVKKKARDYLTKTEIFQFRLDAETYAALFSLAERHRKPAGSLVREWVSERINRELAGLTGATTDTVHSMAASTCDPMELARRMGELGMHTVIVTTPAERSEHELLLSLQKDVEKLKQQIGKRR